MTLNPQARDTLTAFGHALAAGVTRVRVNLATAFPPAARERLCRAFKSRPSDHVSIPQIPDIFKP